MSSYFEDRMAELKANPPKRKWYKMSDHEKRRIKAAHKAGVRWAIAWLHKRALEMNDPHARVILNTAGYHMGIELSRSDVLPAPSREDSPHGRE
jgi:hypothetical protein